jgi:hypothetical protein
VRRGVPGRWRFVRIGPWVVYCCPAMSDHEIRGALFHETRRGTVPASRDRVAGAWLHRVQGGPGTAAVERVCQRAGCQQSATVTLSFRYDARQASLVDLSDEKDPAYYDLCAAHADVLIVPRGWERLDRRTRAPEPEPEVAPDPAPAGAGPDRYAALTAELPRLAEAWGVDAASASRHRSEQTPQRAERPTPVLDGRSEVDEPVVERAGAHPYEPVTRPLLDDEAFELEGQLQMPIEPESRGVVVALTRSRST